MAWQLVLNSTTATENIAIGATIGSTPASINWTGNTTAGFGIFDNGIPSSASPGTATAVTLTSDDLQMKQLVVIAQVTVGHVVVYVTTAEPSSNVTYCIYQGTVAAGALTGATLISSGSAATTATGALEITLSSQVNLVPGTTYIVGMGDDTTSAAFESYSTGYGSNSSALLNAVSNGMPRSGRIPNGITTGGGCANSTLTTSGAASITAGAFAGQATASLLLP
jgi:hypothetical protein